MCECKRGRHPHPPFLFLSSSLPALFYNSKKTCAAAPPSLSLGQFRQRHPKCPPRPRRRRVVHPGALTTPCPTPACAFNGIAQADDGALIAVLVDLAFDGLDDSAQGGRPAVRQGIPGVAGQQLVAFEGGQVAGGGGGGLGGSRCGARS